MNHLSKKIILLLSLVFLPKYAYSDAFAEYKNKFSNVLLVINYNHAYYDSIDFLKKLYSPFFSHIVFYGTNPHPEVTPIPHDRGQAFCLVVEDVLAKYQNYDGYIFLQDDCLLNVWNCLSLDLTKIWLPGKNHGIQTPNMHPIFITTNFQTGANEGEWAWPNPSYGLIPTKKAFAQLSKDELDMLEKNVGKDTAVGALADLFYIPGRFREQALRLSTIFRGVFIEIAAPCIFCCLDEVSNWQPSSMLWVGDATGFLPNWPKEFTCVHPLKFSKVDSRTAIANVFREIFPTFPVI